MFNLQFNLKELWALQWIMAASRLQRCTERQYDILSKKTSSLPMVQHERIVYDPTNDDERIAAERRIIEVCRHGAEILTTQESPTSVRVEFLYVFPPG